MSDELLDIYDENMRLIGAKPRSDVHKHGYWHKCFQCWIVARRAGRGYVLFQRRSAGKSLYPNALDITAAGHLRHGETIQDGLREIEEELGIHVRPSDLVPLGTRCEVARINNLIDREFSETYLYQDNRDLCDYRLDAGEVAGLVEVELRAGMQLFTGEVQEIRVGGTKAASGSGVHELTITARDTVPRIGGYYLKVFIMAERYIEGKRYLAI